MKLGFGWVLTLSAAAVVTLVGVLIWGSRSASDMGDDPIILYCAAGIRRPVEAVAKQYKQQYGIEFQTKFAGSGALLSDIRVGGKGDLYLAADTAYMVDARKFGLIEEIQPLAFQRPVIAVRKDSKANIKGLGDLLLDNVRVSLADPKVAAISRGAKKMLAGTQHDGRDLWEALYESKTVARDTVNAVANDIKSRTVDAGIVWDATASQYPELRIIRVPQFEKRPKNIVIAVLRQSKQPTRALHFLRYLSARDKGLVQFKKFGYDIVKGDKWANKPELTVFAGGLNRPAIEETIKQFEKREGVSVDDSYNGCGILVAEIDSGAIPDLYFACDKTFMTQVKRDFPDSVDISSTEMVIIINKKNKGKLKIEKLENLAQSGLKLGLCSPTQSALGFLSKQLLEKNGLWKRVSANVKDFPATADRLVEHVVFDSLQAAIVYKANTTLQADKLVVIPIDDPDAHAVQPVAIANQSDYKYLTGRLLKQIRSAESRAKFKKLGFEWMGDDSTP